MQAAIWASRLCKCQSPGSAVGGSSDKEVVRARYFDHIDVMVEAGRNLTSKAYMYM